MNLILGAGIAGLSVSWHLGHRDCLILEKSSVIGGHARSVQHDGFTLDHGPHVSFTKHAYVRDLFADNVEDAYEEFPVLAGNFFHGCAIDHPAQVHLWQLPEPLRTHCATDMRAAAMHHVSAPGANTPPCNYAEWLHQSFGRTFAEALPSAYTRKYWTAEPTMLSTDWVGPRMYTPSLEEIDAALVPGNQNRAHYITTARYPSDGGYQRFFERFAKGATLQLDTAVAVIDLEQSQVITSTGDKVPYTRLISTLPLPEFVRLVPTAPLEVVEAAAQLDCSELLLVDVFAPKVMTTKYRWFYVYDEDKLATRIHCVESLAPGNAPDGMTGVQVEVYSSRYRPASGPPDNVARRVAEELVELGFIADGDLRFGRVRVGWRKCRYANIIFTHARRSALETIYDWLSQYGLAREDDDLLPTTDWTSEPPRPNGSVVMAGRFAQWKYFWTDDCVLRGRQIASSGPRAV